ncbi:hypothetical protein AAG906_009959 [Vitis piasezkii]
MPLSRAFEAHGGWIIDSISIRPLPQPIPPRLRDRLTLFLSSGTGTCYIGLNRPGLVNLGYEVDGVSVVPQTPAPFSLIPDEAPFQLTHPTPLVIGCQDAFVPFTLWPEDDDSAGREI